MLNTKRLVFLRKRKILNQTDIAEMLKINVATYGLLKNTIGNYIHFLLEWYQVRK